VHPRNNWERSRKGSEAVEARSRQGCGREAKACTQHRSTPSSAEEWIVCARVHCEHCVRWFLGIMRLLNTRKCRACALGEGGPATHACSEHPRVQSRHVGVGVRVSVRPDGAGVLAEVVITGDWWHHRRLVGPDGAGVLAEVVITGDWWHHRGLVGQNRRGALAIPRRAQSAGRACEHSDRGRSRL
jgi:hypothetical protein